ncbi:hypothetical protein K490DRAFT_63810 [Saccharata proteae CBS 121410]|uniref:Uncharacterized protein n=1 Tax=Saccharata proteae CBS 121410 TaxID=1314787 RepID=A0A6A5YDW5_9PEZI|nr:hypothetical protein K490DRAFT_63810 [Saccharata proteae CBS 121410]
MAQESTSLTTHQTLIDAFNANPNAKDALACLFGLQRSLLELQKAIPHFIQTVCIDYGQDYHEIFCRDAIYHHLAAIIRDLSVLPVLDVKIEGIEVNRYAYSYLATRADEVYEALANWENTEDKCETLATLKYLEGRSEWKRACDRVEAYQELRKVDFLIGARVEEWPFLGNGYKDPREAREDSAVEVEIEVKEGESGSGDKDPSKVQEYSKVEVENGVEEGESSSAGLETKVCD